MPLSTIGRVALRKLAKLYEALTEQRVDELIDEGSWMEICNGK
jgi:hypothetical protein